MILPWLPNEVMCILACSFLSCDIAVAVVTEAVLIGCVVQIFSPCLSTALGFLNKMPERVCHNTPTPPPCYTLMAGIGCKVLTGESQ